MSNVLKRTAGVFVAATIMGGLVAGPAAAGNYPPGTRVCKAALIGKVGTGTVVKLHDGTTEKTTVLVNALVNAKLKVCVKLDADADIILSVKKEFDASGKLIAVDIIANVKAKAKANLVINLTLIGDTYTSVNGVIVIGSKLVVRLHAKVVVVANVAVKVKGRAEILL